MTHQVHSESTPLNTHVNIINRHEQFHDPQLVNIVNLNIGGKQFKVAKFTLETDQLEDKSRLRKIKDKLLDRNVYRNSELFSYVLDYIRDPKKFEPPSDYHLKRLIEEEFTYFGIKVKRDTKINNIFNPQFSICIYQK